MAHDKYNKVVKEQDVERGSEGTQKGDEEALREKIRRLERELRREKLRADLNEEIINVAEEMFGVQIREKTDSDGRENKKGGEAKKKQFWFGAGAFSVMICKIGGGACVWR